MKVVYIFSVTMGCWSLGTCSIYGFSIGISLFSWKAFSWFDDRNSWCYANCV